MGRDASAGPGGVECLACSFGGLLDVLVGEANQKVGGVGQPILRVSAAGGVVLGAIPSGELGVHGIAQDDLDDVERLVDRA
jgi:hypothetical protein